MCLGGDLLWYRADFKHFPLDLFTLLQQHIWSSISQKTAHVASLLISLHWFPAAAHIKFKSQTFPTYLNSLIQVVHLLSSLRSVNEQLVLLSLWGRKSQHKLFSCLVPQWWNELPNLISLISNIAWRPTSSESTYSPNVLFLHLSILPRLSHSHLQKGFLLLKFTSSTCKAWDN